MWFKWARRDPLAREAFASQLAFMKTFNVGYIMDSMLVGIVASRSRADAQHAEIDPEPWEGLADERAVFELEFAFAGVSQGRGNHTGRRGIQQDLTARTEPVLEQS